MRVVLLGYQAWGCTTLKALLVSHHTVPLVISHPDSQHEYETIWTESVNELARTHNVPVIEARSVNTGTIVSMLAHTQPDILLLSDWRTWLAPTTCQIAPYGAVNLHDALLPRYGGFAPINWAVANGEVETGVTAHVVSKDFDLGDIILQQRVPIGPAETATEIFWKTLPYFGKLAIEVLALLESRQVKLTPQDRSQATFFHKRTVRESAIDWNQSNERIYNLIRAQSDPYPNAYTTYAGQKVNIKKARLLESGSFCGTPGRLFCRHDGGVVVVCGSTSGAYANQGLILDVVQEDTRAPVPAEEYFTHMGGYLDIVPNVRSASRKPVRVGEEARRNG